MHLQRDIRSQFLRCAAVLDIISRIVDLSIVLSFLFINKNVSIDKQFFYVFSAVTLSTVTSSAYKPSLKDLSINAA